MKTSCNVIENEALSKEGFLFTRNIITSHGNLHLFGGGVTRMETGAFILEGTPLGNGVLQDPMILIGEPC